MKNTNCKFCSSCSTLLDLVVSTVTSLSNPEYDVSFVIKNEERRVLYSSSLYNAMTFRFPYLESEIDNIISNESLCCKPVGSCVVCSYKLAETRSSSKLFCFIIYSPCASVKTTVPSISRYYHDLQEPLRSISNFLQLLREQPDISQNSESAKYISYAMDNIEKVRKWSSECLFSENDKTYQGEKLTKVKLQDIIQEIKSLLTFQFNNRNFTIDVDKNIPEIPCKKASILSIFKNLIENSLRHSVTNEKNLKIKIYQMNKQADKYIKIIYEDNGIIGESVETPDGHGIGKKIISDMIQSVNGKIKNISKNNGYNKFQIKLPINFPIYGMRRIGDD